MRKSALFGALATLLIVVGMGCGNQTGPGPSSPTVKSPARHERYMAGLPETYAGKTNPLKTTIGNVVEGARLYDLRCAVCHGMDGRGEGPLAGALKIAPSDLTQLAARHGGQFPSAKVADVIRNGAAVLGHGSDEMPAWGLYFGVKGKPEVARSRIRDLVRYVDSLQYPPDKSGKRR